MQKKYFNVNFCEIQFGYYLNLIVKTNNLCYYLTMFRLWAKEYDDNNKIILHKTFKFEQDFDVKFLHAYLEVVCNELKIETPMLLTTHYIIFNNFNRIKFTETDFIDTTDFKFLTIELLP